MEGICRHIFTAYVVFLFGVSDACESCVCVCVQKLVVCYGPRMWMLIRSSVWKTVLDNTVLFFLDYVFCSSDLDVDTNLPVALEMFLSPILENKFINHIRRWRSVSKPMLLLITFSFGVHWLNLLVGPPNSRKSSTTLWPICLLKIGLYNQGGHIYGILLKFLWTDWMFIRYIICRSVGCQWHEGW